MTETEPKRTVRDRQHQPISRMVLEDALPELIASCLGSIAVTIQPLKLGASSLNYHVTADCGEYVARLDVLRTVDALRDDRLVMEACRGVGVDTPPAPMFEGIFLGVPVSVRPYVAGLLASDFSVPSSSLMREAGRQLARIHSAPIVTRRPWFYQTPPALPRVVPDDLAPLVRVAHAWLEAISIASTAETIVHTDYRLENLVTAKGTVVVIDWEKATAGPAWFDVGLALFHLMSMPHRGHSKRAADAFLRGYQDEKPAFDGAFEMSQAAAVAAATFILVDVEIYCRSAEGSRTAVDLAHAEYFKRYCVPTFLRFAERLHKRPA